MTKLEAWEVLREHCELSYEGDELDEMSEYVEQFEQAYDIVEKACRTNCGMSQ